MDIQHKKEAALTLALGVCRGVLLSVQQGDVDREEVLRVLDSTSGSGISNCLGISEGDFPVDWEQLLSVDEINTIKGLS